MGNGCTGRRCQRPLAEETGSLLTPIALIVVLLGGERGLIAMKTQESRVAIQQLDEMRYAVCVDGVVRYVGSREECERRVAILAPKSDRMAQDKSLARLRHLKH
jgi:hypothetical protein